MKHAGKLALKGLIISCLIIGSLYSTRIDMTKLSETLLNIKPIFCCYIILLYIVNFHLVAMRTYFSYKQFNINISYLAAKRAQLSGQLGGLVPIFGSVVSQALDLGKSSQISSTVSTALFFYDKIIMAFTGALLAIAGVFLLFKERIIYNSFLAFTNNTSLIEFIFAVCLCLLIVFFAVIPATARRNAAEKFNLRTLTYILLGMAISLFTWLLSACCFMLIIWSINRGIIPANYWQLFAASVVVSFIASMPVSVNGWGVREFASVSIFSLVFVAQEVALTTAVMIGILSTMALLVMAIIISFGTRISLWSKFESLTR